MKGEFVIMDPKGRFLMGLASSIRGLAHDFTNAEDFAWRFATAGDAENVKVETMGKLASLKKGIPKRYMKIAKVEYRIVG